MSFGNNLLGEAKRASFQQAGGCIQKIRHPYFAGQLAIANSLDKSIDGTFDELDISACAKLDAEFVRAEPLMDSAKMIVMVDGSTVTITNNILAGTMTLNLVSTTGLVSSGDAIAALLLISSIGDKVGGVYSLSESADGKIITTFYYGFTPMNVPHKIKMGNDVPVYPVKCLYSGFIQTVSEAAISAESIWASGSTAGVSAVFSQLGINKANIVATEATTIGTALGDSSTNDTSKTSGITNYDADILAAIDADQTMLGVDFVDGVSVIKKS